MKLALLLTLATTMTGAMAAVDHGGISFHSTVLTSQIDSLKTDINYLFSTPVANPDAEFIKLTEMNIGDGENMHNWLVNRVKYVVGETYSLDTPNIVVGSGYTFPTTPMPEGMGSIQEDSGVKTIMSNLGSALYVVGKGQKTLIGVKFDGKNVFAKSTRVGLLQVGEGLFLDQFKLNPDINHPANSIFRLSTLFHEARHSDGNSGHTAFMHKQCPSTHSYAGHAACELVGNGPYTIGALTKRHLLKNCSKCSPEEISALEAGVVDSFGRVINSSTNARIQSLEASIKSYNEILDAYAFLYQRSTDAAQKERYVVEATKLLKKIDELNAEIAAIRATLPVSVPEIKDARPEGEVENMTLKDSKKLMEKSLKKLRASK